MAFRLLGCAKAEVNRPDMESDPGGPQAVANHNDVGDLMARQGRKPRRPALEEDNRNAKFNGFQGIKKALLQAKSLLLKELASNSTPSSENSAEIPADVFDLSANELERNMSLLLKERGRNKLRAIDDALERIEEGTFGVCEDCGGEIPLGRLEVMPFAATCRDCKSKQERRDKLFSGPREDTFAYDPEDRDLERLDR